MFRNKTLLITGGTGSFSNAVIIIMPMLSIKKDGIL